MIKDIQELNFPKLEGQEKSYATMSAATVSLPDMGEWNITSQIKIDGQIAPDFSFDWEVVHDGHKYIMPLRKPQGSKENTTLNSVIDLTFQHWAIWQLKRWPFVTMQPIDSGTAVADEEVATVSLNLGDLVILFAQVLNYYYGDKITIQLNPDWQYKAEAEVITISHTKVWNVLIDTFQPKYGVRWVIEPNGSYDKYVIKVGYPTTEQSHIFEYGFEGGLMKVERQVQSEEICNLIKGRGGEKNLPYRYFKNVDPENPTFKADPDWIEELANIYFANLMPATFRSYVQGWKAAHISKYPGYTAVGESNAYAPWAYRKGFTDTKFHPVEFVADEITINPEAGDKQVEILPGYSPFVKKGSSLDKYGPLMNSLDNNDEIYPTIQGVTVDPYGRIDEVIEVEPITSDDIEEAAENDAQITTLLGIVSPTLKVGANARQSFTLQGEFSVEEGRTADLITDLTKSGRAADLSLLETEVIIESYSVTLKNKSTGQTHGASGIPAGNYTYQITANVHNASGQDLNVTVACPTPKLIDATPSDKWSSVWRIWVKNIWGTTKQSGETDTEYAKRVWEPILGDRAGNEAKVVFASGMLAHEDYEFVITSIPKYERKKCTWQTVENGQVVSHEYWSEWCIELGKSDAELDTLGVYLPSVMRQAIAGDFFLFIGIDMPHQYTVWNEIRIDDDWKKPILREKKDIKPTWVVQTDRVRLNNEGKPNALIRQLHPGDTLRLADKRFIEGDYETLYLSSLTITYREPTSDDAALNPDVEIVLSDRYEVSANPVAMLQGEVSALAKQVGSISNVEQIMRAVGDKLYLRKDGLPDRSMSPTEFASLLTSLGFRSGMVGGAGWGIYKDANGNWVIEADRFMARQDFEVNNLVINQVVGQGGTIVESAAQMEITRVEETANGYKCYFDQHEGTVANLFHVDDIAWNNRFTPENSDLKFYRRRVIEVGADYVVLTKPRNGADRPAGWIDSGVNGVGIPAEGDAIVQRGNYTDKNRQDIKVRDVIGGGYERYITGLDSVNAEGVPYYFVGRQTGMYNGRPRWFIGDENGFIEWINGVLNIKGSLNMLSTYDGKTLGDYIEDASQAAADAAKAELQAQIDGVIESFNGLGAPTLNNYPANEWTTDAERQRHDRDIYTDITPYIDDTTTPTSGQSWKWYYNSPTDYGWTKIADSEAVRALQLAQMSILGTDVLFKQGESLTDYPAPMPTVNASGTITNPNGWSTDAPEWEAGKYIWQTTYVKKGDGSATFSNPTCISGRDGTSVTITSQSVKYSTNHGATQPADSTFTLNAVPTNLKAGDYLWSRTEVMYSNGQPTVSYAVSRIGTNGTNATIKSSSVTYAKSTTNVQPADSEFTATTIGALNIALGEYLWTKTTVTYSDDTPVTSYSVSRIGSDGDTTVAGLHIAYATGITGSLPHPTSVTDFATSMQSGKVYQYMGIYTDDQESDSTDFNDYEWAKFKGNGIDRIEEEYYLSTSRTALQGGSWSTIRQTWVAGCFYWTRSHVYYTDGTDETYGEVCVTGEKGESAYTLDLTDEVKGIACDASGNPIPTSIPTSQASVWKGSTKLTSGITYSIAQTDGVSATVTSAGVVTPSALTKDNATIVVQASVDGVTLQSTISIYKVIPGKTGANYSPNLLVGTKDGFLVSDTIATGDWGNYKLVKFEEGTTFAIGDKIALSAEYIRQLAGNATQYNIILYRAKKGSTGLTDMIAPITSVSRENPKTVLTVNALCEAEYEPVLCIYSGLNGQLKGTQAQYGRIMAVRGDKYMDWSPAASEMIGQDGEAAVVYQLEPSVDNIIKSMTGELSATSVSCSVYKVTGNSPRVLTGEKTLTCYKVKKDGSTTTTIIPHTNGISSGMSVTEDTEAVIFELTDSTTVLDRERVPVISDASDLEVGGTNLLRNSELRAEYQFSSNGDNYKLMTDRTVHLEKGRKYTISARTNASAFSNVHNGSSAANLCVLWICTVGVNEIVSGTDMTTDGSKGHTFVWNHPTGDYYIRVNFYIAGTWWVEKIKIERGNVATDWSPSPDDVKAAIGKNDYLQVALKETTKIDGGLIIATAMLMGQNNTDYTTQTTWSGINGAYMPDAVGGGIAAFYGGDMEDLANYYTWSESEGKWNPKSGITIPSRIAKGLDRMDGSGYRAGGRLWWDDSGLYANGVFTGQLTVGAKSGQHIDLDPMQRVMNIFGANGELVAIHSGRILSLSEAQPSTATNTTGQKTASFGATTVNITSGTSSEKIVIRDICSGNAADVKNSGVLTIKIGKYTLSAFTQSVTDPMQIQPMTSIELRLVVIIGGDRSEYLLGRADSIGLEKTTITEEQTFHIPIPKGNAYEAKIEAKCFIKGSVGNSGTLKAESAANNVKYDLVLSAYRCEYGANGWIISLDSNNYAYLIVEGGKLNFKIVSGGNPVISS